MYTYQNPVIRGFNPDPSFCRVGDDFYLVTSTFEFFPGLPIYHSKNLVDWELINYCVTDSSVMDLSDEKSSGGLYAPTIRYHDGTFYVICTNMSHGGNFIMHTKDIYGKWSEPHWIDQDGFDPSVFFDDDGKCYFCNTLMLQNRMAIFAFELNPLTGEILSEKRIISYGGAGGKCPEAPHIYKMRGYYYLMLAEGGTEYGHMETIFRSRDIYGPYTPCPRNPILSHKDYMDAPIQATGHADLLQDQNGNWWMVCLGIRTLGVLLHNMGRETFLVPVIWSEDGWPIAGNNGTIENSMYGPLPCSPENSYSPSFTDDFNDTTLNLRWNFVRNPNENCYQVRESRLHLYGNDQQLYSLNPTFIGVRQQEFCLRTETDVEVIDLSSGGKAGITAFYNKEYHYSLSITSKQQKTYLVLEACVHGIKSVVSEIEYNGKSARLAILSDKNFYDFQYLDNYTWKSVGKLPVAGLCSEGTLNMTFTGTYLGVFAVNTHACFDRFSIAALE